MEVVYISSGEEDDNQVHDDQMSLHPLPTGLEDKSRPIKEIDKQQDVKRMRLDSLFGPKNYPKVPIETLKEVPYSSNSKWHTDEGEAEIMDDIEDSQRSPDFTNNKLRKDSMEGIESNADNEDLIIIDAEIAAKTSKFKKSSFERDKERVGTFLGFNGDLRTNFEFHGPANTESNTAQFGNSYSEIFNRPAPVPHFTLGDKAEVQKLRISRAKSSIDDYTEKKKELLRRHESITREYMSNLKTADLLLGELTAMQAKFSELKKELDSNFSLEEALKENIIQKGREYHDVRRRREANSADLRSISSNIATIRTYVRHLYSEITELESPGSEDDEVEIIEENKATRSGNMLDHLAYSQIISNVYANNDLTDLQNLLNNIKPDEEESGEGLEATPPELSVNLLKHQRMGLSWLLRMERSKSRGGILADDMGLGKTIQALSLILSHRSTNSSYKTTLVVAPVSLLRQWYAEMEQKVNPNLELKIGIFHGPGKKEFSNFDRMKSLDVVLTSYGTISSEWKKHYGPSLREAQVTSEQNVIPDLNSGGEGYTSPFFARNAIFHRIILDEAQNIKNKASVASRAVYCIKAIFRLCLSGTPIQNNIDELYPILRFLRIKPYDNEIIFRTDIAMPIKSKASHYDQFDKRKGMQKLQALLRAILLRRTKETLIDGRPILLLPKKIVSQVKITMNTEELEYYKSLESRIQKKARTLLSTKKIGMTSGALTLLLRLRQACCHSFLVEIGEMRAADNANNISRDLKDWELMYNRVKSFDEEVVHRIKQELQSDNQSQIDPSEDEDLFTCPICYDVRGYRDIVMFPVCGHMICYNCVDTYFDRFEVGESADGSRIASCIECSSNFKKSDLIDYDIFHKIHHENYDRDMFESYYSRIGKNTTISNNQMIKELIMKYKGFVLSAKIRKCIELIKEITANSCDEKVIIFSQFTSLFDLMNIAFKREGIDFLRYDGSMQMEQKNDVIKQFYQGSQRSLLISLRAGNVGLTLTCASHVIIMDPFWNPYVEEQAMDRAHRIGQQKEVKVYRLLIDGTVESRIVSLQEEKKELISGALDENGLKSVSKLGRQELGFLFGINDLR